MRHRQAAMRRTVPPVELYNLGEAQIGDQVRYMAWDDDSRGSSADAQIVLHDRPQRGPMQVIEVGVRHQHQIDSRQIPYSQPRTPQPLQHEKPASEVGIDHHALPGHLHEETGMPDERNPQLAVGSETRFMGLAAKWSYRGMPHQSTELRRPFAKGRIAKRCLDHPMMPIL